MRLVHNILIAVVLGSLVFLASCCCTGGLDDDEIVINDPHNQGTGGD